MDISDDAATGGRTLIDVLQEMADWGYRADVRARADGQVSCDACGSTFDAADLRIDDVQRLEGASDPADMMLVAAVRCPSCEALGTLVLTYGPMASEIDNEVDRRLSVR